MAINDEIPDVAEVNYSPLAYVNEDCPHCNAEWGHYVFCPLINRESAEARRSLFQPTAAQQIEAHGMGITL